MAPMPLGDRVRERRKALQLTQEQLAKAVRSLGGELSQQQLASIEAGTVKRPRALPELALSLKTTPDELLRGDGVPANQKQPISHEFVTEASVHRGPLVTAPEPLILFRSTPGGRHGGETLIYKERAGLVPRPDFLRYAKGAFASTVTNDDNSPAYRTRDTILVDPTNPAVVGDDCVFVKDANVDPMETVSAHLVKITATNWTVHQYGGKQRDYDLPRSDFHEAWRIVGRYNR
jgi:transcriptional regulator with XRE-family HTH domain